MHGFIQRTESLGGLDCIVLSPESATPELAVVLCHGFGEQGSNLAACVCGATLAQSALRHPVVFVFPDSPWRLVNQPAWWTPDFSHLADGNPRHLRDDCPDELPESRRRILAVVDAVMTTFQLPASRIVLGGFSQGAMLATDVALCMSDAPAGLCVWAGSLLNEAQWRPLAAKRGFMRVLEAHSRNDAALPFKAAIWLRDMFEESGFDVRFVEYSGGHTIPAEGITGLVSLIDDTLGA
jgi:phospholipase/carboxylesterase